MLPTSAGFEPTTSWSPVGRRIQLSHRGQHIRCRVRQHLGLHSLLTHACPNIYSYYGNIFHHIQWFCQLTEKVLTPLCGFADWSGPSLSTLKGPWPRRGLNPLPPGLQSDGASNWATEAGTSDAVFGSVCIYIVCSHMPVPIFTVIMVIYSTISSDSVSWQKRPWPHYVVLQTDQDLRCLHLKVPKPLTLVLLNKLRCHAHF